jgi:hypothetical protein
MGKQNTALKKVYTEPEDAAKKARGKKKFLPPDSWAKTQSQGNITFRDALE